MKKYKQLIILRSERIRKKEDETIRSAAKGCKSPTDLLEWKNLNRKSGKFFSAVAISIRV